jgi:hypothetical protein
MELAELAKLNNNASLAYPGPRGGGASGPRVKRGSAWICRTVD